MCHLTKKKCETIEFAHKYSSLAVDDDDNDDTDTEK